MNYLSDKNSTLENNFGAVHLSLSLSLSLFLSLSLSLPKRERALLRKQGGGKADSAIANVVKIDFALSAHVRAQELNLRSPHMRGQATIVYTPCAAVAADGISRMRNAEKVDPLRTSRSLSMSLVAVKEGVEEEGGGEKR